MLTDWWLLGHTVTSAQLTGHVQPDTLLSQEKDFEYHTSRLREKASAKAARNGDEFEQATGGGIAHRNLLVYNLWQCNVSS